MTPFRIIGLVAGLGWGLVVGQAGLTERLAFSSPDGAKRARLSGSVVLEGHQASAPTADLIFADTEYLFTPRFELNLDAQVGAAVYGFAQLRVDRGFDPSAEDLEVRWDEYAIRWSAPGSSPVSVQAGKFATVVGNWTRRHSAWDNPLVTPPLPYDNLTGIWDVLAAPSPEALLAWSHVRPVSGPAAVFADKQLRLPIIWGPAYTTGVAVAGAHGRLDYAFEVKNASVASRPVDWDLAETGWRQPAAYARVGFRPDERWNLGLSAGRGDYLNLAGRRRLPSGQRPSTHQKLVAADASFAWHHLQVWGEVFAADFEVPGIGKVGTLAYYVEAKRKLTPQLFGAVRWGQQFFDEVGLRNGQRFEWGRRTWRAELALGYRFTAQTQLKAQLGLRQESPAPDPSTAALAVQWLAKF